ncbi:lipid A deacylase LpxR family protein [Alteromonas sp. ASW11-19]|uniref:Lipid A deacylase LpxR family protein n=1 Tax=Alteromonas salexigens TaxID=2982530 RepID=A0ABT2VSG1_9ALTE|nr:lipid A deacylase LpxR family protein [Alteromonas salexigens]MCU7556080.1 lipid A deacylase LpxR family protein [Alteromonas salexigens]
MRRILPCLLMTSLPVLAEPDLIDIYQTTTQGKHDAYSIDVENDFFTWVSDRYYTNGLRYSRIWTGDYFLKHADGDITAYKEDKKLTDYNLSYKPDLRDECDFQPTTLYQLHYQVNVLGCDKNTDGIDIYQYHAGWYAANLIYTPFDITATRDEFQPFDRPFAGYTYVGGFVQTRYADDASTRYDLQVGILGRASLSEDIQQKWHCIWELDHPTWDTQIATEPAVQLNVRHDFAIPSWMKVDDDPLANTRYLDIQPYIMGELGNVFVRARAGLNLRVGYNVRGYFSGAPFQSSILKENDRGHLPNLPNLPEPKKTEPERFNFVSVYLFLNYEETAVWHNATIEGGVLRDSEYTQDAASRFKTIGYGVRVEWSGAFLSFGFKERSPEIEGIPFNDRHHRWGEVQWGMLL